VPSSFEVVLLLRFGQSVSTPSKAANKAAEKAPS